MILGIIILLIVAATTYWHYAQGFFSATFSAVSAVIAAVLAISYQEWVVRSLLQGKMADYANAMAMVALFAFIYIILRTLFDNLVPGNIRLPLYVDRVGGALMGVVASLCAAGVFALAAQAMPFGPAVGGYARYAIDDSREVSISPGGGARNIDVSVEDQLKEDYLDPASKKSLIIPADDVVLGLVTRLSDGGSLAGTTSFASVHPDYADELFAQRLGVQIGAKRTASNVGGKSQVSVPSPGVFRFDKDPGKSQLDGEIAQIHQRAITFKPKAPDDFPLVVRVMFNHDAGDEDGMVRFGTGNIRLVANGTNYWPVGTVENGSKIYLNKLDDHLIVDVKTKDRGVDFIFFVDQKKVLTGNDKDKERKIEDRVFLEVKRLAVIDLSGQALQPRVKPSKDVEVMRKKEVQEKDTTARKGGSDTAGGGDAADASAGPIAIQNVQVADKLFTPINVGTPDANVPNQQLKSGTCSLKEKKFAKLAIEPIESIRLMSEGSFGIDTFFVPTGQKMVQVIADAPAEGDAWAWANNLQQFALTDAAGKTYKPAGAWARVKQQGADRLAASYDSTGATPSINQTEGRPTAVWIAFLVPSGTQLKSLNYQAKAIREVTETVQ